MKSSNWMKYAENEKFNSFKNISEYSLIEDIIIVKKNAFKGLYFLTLKITFSRLLNEKLEQIFEDLINLCKNEKFVYGGGNLIRMYNGAGYIFEEVIQYLEKIEEIQPLAILENLLSGVTNPYNYPKILKQKIDHNIKKINFEILYKLDKDYHDNFINSLNIKNQIKILKFNKHNTFQFNYDLLNILINDELNINNIKKLIRIIDFLSQKNKDYDKIYENKNIYLEYLNHLSIDDILNKLTKEKMIYNRVFEIINYLYTQDELTFNQNILLIKLINDKYQKEELIILKNKIICKLITKNTNLDNEVFNELSKFEDTIEGLIQFIINKK